MKQTLNISFLLKSIALILFFLCSFAFCLVMYLSVGIVGYIMFGEKAESQFTLNMPKELYASKIATWTTVRKQN
jgi:hypothetical protein